MSNFDNTVTFELRLRNNDWFKLVYSVLNPYRLIFPCNIYTLKNNQFVLGNNALSIKNYLMDNNYIFIAKPGYMPLLLSRREISHLYGPFEYNKQNTITKIEAADLKDTSLKFMEKRYKDYDEVPTHIFQEDFGAITSVKRTQRRDITTTIVDIRQNGVIYNSMWLEDVIKREKTDLCNLRIFLLEKNLQSLVSELDAYMESDEYKRKVQYYEDEVRKEKITKDFLLQKFGEFLNAAE